MRTSFSHFMTTILLADIRIFTRLLSILIRRIKVKWPIPVFIRFKQSKYCIPQPFSRCLISICSHGLFDCDSIFIFFDWSRSRLIQVELQWSFAVFAVVFQALLYITDAKSLLIHFLVLIVGYGLLMTLQNCTNMLRNLTFVVQFALD